MNRYWKSIILGMIVVFWLISNAFSSFDDKMYCEITKNEVIISLENKSVYPCQIYIKYIELQMKKVYKDLELIQKYIDQKRDLWYWRPLKEEKIELIGLYQNIRLNILSHMQNFEFNMVETSKKFFLNGISDYRKKIGRTMIALASLQDQRASRYIYLLEQQKLTIEKIEGSVSVDQLNANINRYVYLKQQIEWR